MEYLLNEIPSQIDSTLSPYNNVKKDRWRAYAMATVSLIVIGILLGLDVGTWVRMAQEMNISDEDTGEVAFALFPSSVSSHIPLPELNVQWYIPFYSLYFILTGLHINFANTAYGLGRRYKRLNQMLRTSYLSGK